MVGGDWNYVVEGEGCIDERTGESQPREAESGSQHSREWQGLLGGLVELAQTVPTRYG